MGKGLPSSWRVAYPDDIVSAERAIVSGPFGSSIGKRFFVEDGVPVIRGRNLTLGVKRFVDEGFVFLTEEKAKEFGNCQAIVGDIVFTAAGTLGQVGLILSNAKYPVYIVSNKQLRVRPDPGIASPLYLYYWFSSKDVRNYIVGLNTGSSVPLISLRKLRSVPINLPPLRTQHKIASILSTYDDLIENNLQRIKILEEMAQNLYREWFVKFRFPGYQHARFIDSPVGKIPEGWEVKTVGDVADVNARSIRKSEAPAEIVYIDIASVSIGSIDKMEALSFVDAPSRARRIATHGDIVWSSVRPNRRSFCLIIDPPENLIVSTGFAVISPKTVPFSYLYLAVTTDDFVSYLVNHATGAAYPAVNSEDFKNAGIIIPDQQMLSRFDDNVLPIANCIHRLRAMNTSLCRTRNLLLPRLISGEIDVSELNIAVPEEATA